MVSKVFFPINGGLGDAYKGYWSYAPYGKLGPLKEKYPNCRVKFIVCSHNPETAGFYKFHPHVDEVESRPAVRRDPGDDSPGKIIEERFGDGWTPASALLREFRGLPYTKPLVHLKDQKEEDFVKRIAARGKYICMHPLAGGVVRNVPDTKTYYRMARSAVSKLGCNVVILGGSYERVTERGRRFTRESFPYNSEGIINLMDKTNARTAAQIVRNSDGFIGTWSCFLCAILDTDIRGVTFIPSGRPALISGATYKNLSKEIKPIFIGKNTDITQVKKDTIDWFRGHI